MQKGLSECEQMVMKCIWGVEDEIGVQELTGLVNQRYQREWKLQTVSTFLARLVKKGYLSMYRRGRTFFYKPLVSEKEYRGGRLRDEIHFWNGGSAAEYVLSIYNDAGLTEKEKKEIRELVASL